MSTVEFQETQMAGVYKLEINESAEELKQMLVSQKTAYGYERIQLLYLLKTGQATTIKQAAHLLGRNRVTLQTWLRQYREGGIERLLEKKHSPGRPRAIPTWAEQALEKKLEDSQGMESYGEICQWLREKLGITAKYKTVHKLVFYRLKAAPKVSRTQSASQSKMGLQAIKKTSQPT